MAGRQGPYRSDYNSTNYVHPNEENLWDLHKAMDYNAAGQPLLRVNGQFSGASVDAFNRLRVSNPATIFDSQQIHVESNQFTTELFGGATKTYLVNESSVAMTVGTAINDEVIRQTKRVMPYQPGKSLLIFNTFVFNTPKPGLRQRIGYFSARNGIYLENDGVTNYIVLRSYTTGAVVERRIAQSDWNVDKFDGTGLSANATDRTANTPTLDVTKTNIMWMDVEWLGVGDVRVGFVVDGAPMVAHIFHNDNRNTSVYMTTACLPLRYEIKNVTAQTSSSTMKQICASVVSEGGYNLQGVIHGCGRGFTTATALDLGSAGTEVPLIAFRLKEDRTNSVVIPEAFRVYVDSNATISYRVWIGADVTGGTWESRPTYSSVEFNVGVTSATYTNADLVQGGFVTGGGAIIAGTGNIDNLNYQLQYWNDNTRPTVLLTAIGTTNNNKVLSKAEWIELI
jgi:hypothetical protein